MPLKKVGMEILPTSASVRIEAINLLVDKLGLSKASIFIRENLSQKTDYLKIKEKLFAGKTLDDLYKEIKK